ncbi:hypothetical protein [Phenylobacterium sp.]|uniref:hypothetical protein n=1 Tax=Phenylobacterium sp. TaxID=1871053 RepID=UPI0035B12693
MEREAQHRRELAYYTAVLPRLKRPPTFRAFVGEGRARSAPEVQTPEQMEAVLDHWAHLMKAAEVQRETLSHP